ncbi:hypothetical protein [Pseudoxanthomonas sp. PXM05]|uniref:hypothetical protein n=1 Tax=Pseudoxanthomonas sp. PXM05 TaxID=2854775 RepID=UPI001C46E66C|nr:hypothetical protein [Pseudoxanthomonas sp. PXM05]MBV7475361.1 hypothetical protein [Pseudoxanthomonas sp. PXM05]
MSAITKEGIEVQVGQVWRDLDKRLSRTVVVEHVDDKNGIAHVRSSNGARSRIAIKRMHKYAQGFALVTPIDTARLGGEKV